jgi:Raf kinase inhibitor-like YbhB/YbcL family protein
MIPAKYTQDANQVSPVLTWTNAPQGTVSFVVSMEDPDVAVNRTTDTQVHWLVWNIPASATGLPEGVAQGAQLPDGSRQISATGPVYRGPGAPATGPVHHYTISVYALDTMLDVPAAGAPPEGTNAAAHAVNIRRSVYNAMSGHILGKAVYVGLFKRAPQQ